MIPVFARREERIQELDAILGQDRYAFSTRDATSFGKNSRATNCAIVEFRVCELLRGWGCKSRLFFRDSNGNVRLRCRRES